MKKIEFKITGAERGAAFVVTLVSKASKTEIVGRHGDAIKIKVTAPPEKGKANEQLLELLAEKLGVSKGQLEIVAGAKSRHKIISVTGVTPQEVEEKLLG